MGVGKENESDLGVLKTRCVGMEETRQAYGVKVLVRSVPVTVEF